MSKLQKNPILNYIKEVIPFDVRETHHITPLDILQSLKVTQEDFCPEKSLKQILDEEKEYYIQFGMSAFKYEIFLRS
ncbi:MAG: hypothetical protein M0R03_11025 [Novosphingobium sp.]|nr:hypothetical protein [Novosphingobium sp.]